MISITERSTGSFLKRKLTISDTSMKKEQKNWDSLDGVLDAIDACGPYLILRNFEELSDQSYYMDGHDDIDFLCEDVKKVKSVLDVRKDVCWKSQHHFFIKLGDKDVKIGLRYVGDNYYDVNWEKEMLRTRIKGNGNFYRMDQENYFFSLLYHAVLQKKRLSDDYRIRLNKMGEELSLDLKGEEDFYSTLFAYMKRKNYKVVYPTDSTVTTNYAKVESGMKKGFLPWRIRRILFAPRIMIKALKGITGRNS